MSRNVPSVPTVPEEGNTRLSSSTVNPAKKWCFTLNNFTETEVEMLKTHSCSKVPKIMFQSEMGEEGTPHLQGWLEFKTKQRPMTVFKNTKRISWRKMKGTIDDNIDYCSKTDTYTGEVRYARGVSFPYTGPQITLYDWQKPVVNMLKETPHDRRIYWVWSAQGNLGKSTFAKWIFHNVEDTIVTGGKANDMKNGVQTYIKTNFKFPRVVLVDIPRVNRGHFSIAGIEEIKNMFFFSGKYEGGMVSGPPPHVICFANVLPEFAEMSADRWYLMDLQDENPEFRAYM
ncbi:MAG: putative viral replication protein [Circoviridae sp.]|nr:MAG: putative viral replication protein [Circoviridae sp.]